MTSTRTVIAALYLLGTLGVLAGMLLLGGVGVVSAISAGLIVDAVVVASWWLTR